jgi:hypothetical protein
VHSQQAEIVDRLDLEDDEDVDDTAETYESEPAPVVVMPTASVEPRRRVSKPRSMPGSKGKAAFTLRLDPERHLKLRLACAVNGRSAQQIVTDAVDQLLEAMPELDSMAAKVNHKG